MAKSDTMMMIAFPNGGILPGDVTGGEELSVAAHEPVEVPRAYGEHLVNDRFAYEAKPDRKGKSDSAPADAARSKLEAQLAGLRGKLGKASHPTHKDKLAAEITEIERKLAELTVD